MLKNLWPWLSIPPDYTMHKQSKTAVLLQLTIPFRTLAYASPAFCFPSWNLPVAANQGKNHGTRPGCNRGWAARGTRPRRWPERVPEGSM